MSETEEITTEENEKSKNKLQLKINFNGIKLGKKDKVKKDKIPGQPKQKKSKQENEDSESAEGAESNGGKKKKPLLLIAISGGLLLTAGVVLAVLFLNKGAPTTEERLAEAAGYVAVQKYDDAEKIYNKLIEQEPSLAEPYLGVADIRVLQENLEEALTVLGDALEPTENDARIQAKIDELTPKPEGEENEKANDLFSEEPIVWQDTAFEKMVRIALDKNDGEAITEAELSGIVTLKILGSTYAVCNASHTDDEDGGAVVYSRPTGYEVNGVLITERGEIKRLADIAHFKKLRKLTVGYNTISDISGIGELEALETVGLYFNEIADISALANLEKLQYLYIYGNQISDISPLAGLTELKELWLNRNKISDIKAVSGLKSLYELYLSNNEVSDITPVAGLPSLRIFHASNNKIEDISAIRDMQSLTDVSFTGNPVTEPSSASTGR